MWKIIENLENNQNKVSVKLDSLVLLEKKLKRLEENVQSGLENVEKMSTVSQNSRKSDKKSKTERRMREDMEQMKKEIIQHQDHLNQIEEVIQNYDELEIKTKTMAPKSDLKRLARQSLNFQSFGARKNYGKSG